MRRLPRVLMLCALLAAASVTSLSVIAPTPDDSTRTRTSSLPTFSKACTMASADPCTSAFTNTGSSATDWSALAFAISCSSVVAAPTAARLSLVTFSR